MLHDESPRFDGHGVRFDRAARRYLVRNEAAGVWLRQDSGELKEFAFFSDAHSARRGFEVSMRPGEK
ncbi:hypothetical protein [Kitasatospora sp. NPDC086791]|uniref:hypothetical protein n=1 Tax=Kitasatospora sp. NPDC086791 TaxID=3155178 RepID=UPI0034344255